MPSLDAIAPFGSGLYFLLLGVVLAGRGADLFSTWIATPTLALEANPIARWLGWKAGIVANLVMAALVALLPLAAISIATTSIMVAARNLQSAWLIRAVGEHAYQSWIAARYRNSSPGIFFCLLALHTGLITMIGAALMSFSGQQLVPFAMGFGIVVYAIAVSFFTSLSMRRAARQQRALASLLHPFGSTRDHEPGDDD